MAASGFAGEFLAVGAGARGLALGSAYVALVDDGTAGYWNPAALATARGRQAHFMHAERYAGLVDQDFVAIVLPGVALDGASLSLLRLGVGGIEYTSLPDASAAPGPDNRPFVSSTETAADYALYLSAGQRLTERLDAGASAKIIYRTVADVTAYGLGLDVGLRYRLGGGLALAANLRDVTTTPVFWETDATDRIRPSVAFGVAFARRVAGGRAAVAMGSRAGGDAAPDGDGSPVNAGFEYRAGLLAVRAGLEEERLTYGLGLQLTRGLGVDVAYLQHDDLEGTYLVSADLGF